MSKLGLFGESTIVDEEGNVSTASDMQGKGKVIGIYFSAHWCPPCRGFTPKLAEKYNELRAAGKDFEVIFVSSDRSEADAASYFADMPWKMLKYSERDAKTALSSALNVNGIPFLVLLNAEGELLTADGREAIMDCPYDQLHEFAEVKKEKERIKELTLAGIKDSSSTGSKLPLYGENNLITKDGKRVSAISLAGKTIGFYFGIGEGHPGCLQLTPKLIEKYNELNSASGEKVLEIIFVSFDRSPDGAKSGHAGMPWLMLDPADDLKYLLAEAHDLSDLPTLVLVNGDGHVLTTEGAAAIFNTPLAELGLFAAKRRARKLELEAIEAEFADPVRAKLPLFGQDNVVDKDGTESSVADLQGKGKVIGIYFSAHWCPPCRGFTPKLAEKYNELRAAGKDFEVIFVSSDRSEADAASYFADMPWKMLKYSERDTKGLLSRVYGVDGIPSLVLLDGDGNVLTLEGIGAILSTPFDKLARLTEEAVRMDRFYASLPDTVEHACRCGSKELVKVNGPYSSQGIGGRYGCDHCDTEGNGWAYHCNKCDDGDLHPGCVPCLDCSEAAVAKFEAAQDEDMSNKCIE